MFAKIDNPIFNNDQKSCFFIYIPVNLKQTAGFWPGNLPPQLTNTIQMW